MTAGSASSTGLAWRRRGRALLAVVLSVLMLSLAPVPAAAQADPPPTLSSLTAIDSADNAVTLTHVGDDYHAGDDVALGNRARTVYRASVANTVTSVRLTPTTGAAGATITVGGTTVASGAQSGALSLEVGDNEIQVVVEGAGGASRLYVVRITRAWPATAKPLQVALSPSDGQIGKGESLTVTPTVAVADRPSVATRFVVTQVDPESGAPILGTDFELSPNHFSSFWVYSNGTVSPSSFTVTAISDRLVTDNPTATLRLTPLSGDTLGLRATDVNVGFTHYDDAETAKLRVRLANSHGRPVPFVGSGTGQGYRLLAELFAPAETDNKMPPPAAAGATLSAIDVHSAIYDAAGTGLEYSGRRFVSPTVEPDTLNYAVSVPREHTTARLRLTADSGATVEVSNCGIRGFWKELEDETRVFTPDRDDDSVHFNVTRVYDASSQGLECVLERVPRGASGSTTVLSVKVISGTDSAISRTYTVAVQRGASPLTARRDITVSFSLPEALGAQTGAPTSLVIPAGHSTGLSQVFTLDDPKLGQYSLANVSFSPAIGGFTSPADIEPADRLIVKGVGARILRMATGQSVFELVTAEDPNVELPGSAVTVGSDNSGASSPLEVWIGTASTGALASPQDFVDGALEAPTGTPSGTILQITTRPSEGDAVVPVQVPAGDQDFPVEIPLARDDVMEGAEAFTVTLISDPPYLLSTDRQTGQTVIVPCPQRDPVPSTCVNPADSRTVGPVTVHIAPSGSATLTVTASAAEDGDETTFTGVLDPSPDSAIAVGVGGGVTFRERSPGSTLADRETSLSFEDTDDDGLLSGAELTVEVSRTVSSGANRLFVFDAVAGSLPRGLAASQFLPAEGARGIIPEDDDLPPAVPPAVVSFAGASAVTFSEGIGGGSLSGKLFAFERSVAAFEGSDAVLDVHLFEDAPTGGLAFDVAYVFSGHSGTAADLDPARPTTLSVPAGARRAQLAVPLFRDGDDEGTETVGVSLSVAGGASQWAPVRAVSGTATIHITDIGQSLADIYPDPHVAVLDMVIDPPQPAAFAVALTLVGDGAAPATRGTDFIAAVHPSVDTGTGRERPIAGLDNGDGYEVRVRASNAAGNGPWETAIGIPNAPTKVPGAPVILGVVPADSIGLEVRWAPAPPSDAVTGYVVEYQKSGQSTWTGGSYGASETTATLNGLDTSFPYDVRMYARNDQGISSYATASGGIPREVTQAPGAPAGLRAAPADGILYLRWEAAPGSVASAYDVYYKESTAFAWNDAFYGGAATATTIKGLTNGTLYDVRVQARNRAGSSSFASASGTPAAATQVPGAPVNLRTAAYNGALNVTWAAPPGSTVTSYTVQYKGVDDAGWTEAGTGNFSTVAYAFDAAVPVSVAVAQRELQVDIVDDGVVEADETFVVRLHQINGEPYTVGSSDRVTVTIADDDTAVMTPLVLCPPVEHEDTGEAIVPAQTDCTSATAAPAVTVDPGSRVTFSGRLSAAVEVGAGGQVTFTDAGTGVTLDFYDSDRDGVLTGPELFAGTATTVTARDGDGTARQREIVAPYLSWDAPAGDYSTTEFDFRFNAVNSVLPAGLGADKFSVESLTVRKTPVTAQIAPGPGWVVDPGPDGVSGTDDDSVAASDHEDGLGGFSVPVVLSGEVDSTDATVVVTATRTVPVFERDINGDLVRDSRGNVVFKLDPVIGLPMIEELAVTKTATFAKAADSLVPMEVTLGLADFAALGITDDDRLNGDRTVTLSVAFDAATEAMDGFVNPAAAPEAVLTVTDDEAVGARLRLVLVDGAGVAMSQFPVGRDTGVRLRAELYSRAYPAVGSPGDAGYRAAVPERPLEVTRSVSVLVSQASGDGRLTAAELGNPHGPAFLVIAPYRHSATSEEVLLVNPSVGGQFGFDPSVFFPALGEFNPDSGASAVIAPHHAGPAADDVRSRFVALDSVARYVVEGDTGITLGFTVTDATGAAAALPADAVLHYTIAAAPEAGAQDADLAGDPSFASGTVAIAQGDSTGTIAIPDIVDDNDKENSEGFVVTLDKLVKASDSTPFTVGDPPDPADVHAVVDALGARTEFTIALNDQGDPPSGRPVATISSHLPTEVTYASSDWWTWYLMRITRPGNYDGEITGLVVPSGGTASADDYFFGFRAPDWQDRRHEAATTFTIPEGSDSTTLYYRVPRDGIVEADETFEATIHIATPGDGTVLPPTTQPTITIDSTEAAFLRLCNTPAASEGQRMEVAVCISGPDGNEVAGADVNFTLTPTFTTGTGKAAAADFLVPVENSPALREAADLAGLTIAGTIPAGETRASVWYLVATDQSAEGNETFSLAVSFTDGNGGADDGSSQGGELTLSSLYATETATITNVAPVADATTYSIDERFDVWEGRDVTLVVRLGQDAPTGGLEFSVAPDYAGSTAAAGDVGTVPATVTVPAGARAAVLTFATVDDLEEEDFEETLMLGISTTATGWTAASSGAGAAEVVIFDNEVTGASETEPVTLVSNLGQQVAGRNAVATSALAQDFTTGSNAAGYTVDSIVLPLVALTDDLTEAQTKTVYAELWSATSEGAPHSKLATLAPPDDIDYTDTGAGGTQISFDAPADTVLRGDTTYFVVMHTGVDPLGSDGARTKVGWGTTRTGEADTADVLGFTVGNAYWRTGVGGDPACRAWGESSAGFYGHAAQRFRVIGTVNATKTTSSNADLSALAAGGSADGSTFAALSGAGALVPALASGTTGYRATVGNDTTHVQLTPTVADTGKATVKVGTSCDTMKPVTSGDASEAIALELGDNEITVEVTAEDLGFQQYTVTVRRVPAGTVWHATLVPVAYTAAGNFAAVGCQDEIAGAECSSQLTANTFKDGGDTGQEFGVYNIVDFPGISFQFALADNRRSTAALAELTFCLGDEPYEMDANANAPVSDDSVGWTAGVPVSLSIGASCTASSDADLSALAAESSTDGSTFGALDLYPAFDAATTAYTTIVDESVTHVRLTPATADDSATVKVGKGATLSPVASGSASDPIALELGDNLITVEVTAQDASTQAYTVNVRHNTIWTATFTPPTTTSGAIGCFNAAECTAALTDDDFTAGGQDYSLTTLTAQASSGGTVVAEFDAAVNTVLGQLNLCAGSTALALSDATLSNSNQTATWTSVGSPLPWSQDVPVHLSIGTSCVPTIALSSSASGDTATEGDTVTITATLSEAAPTGGVTVTLTRQSESTAAETDDYTLAGTIFIAATETTGTTSLTIVDDTDVEAHETVVLSGTATGLTVGTQPATVVTAALLTVTVNDNDTPAKLQSARLSSFHERLSLEWIRAAGEVTGYDVHYTSAGADAVADDAAVQTGQDPLAADGWVDTAHTTPPDLAGTGYLITGLKNGTEYRVRVRAASAAGGGAWTVEKGTPALATIRVDINAIGPFPEGRPSPVTIIAVLSEHAPTGGVTVTLEKSGTATETDDYTLGAGSIAIAAGSSIGETTLTIVDDTDVEAHETIALSGAATGFTEDSQPVIIRTAEPLVATITDNDTPAKPASLMATALHEALSLTWTAPDGVLTGYDVHYTSAPKMGAGSVTDTAAVRSDNDDSAGWVDAEYAGVEASDEIRNLVDGTEYRVRVRAASAAGKGAWEFTMGTPELPGLVSNHGQTQGASYGANGYVNAQAFTTGSHDAGYALSSVDIVVENAPNATQRETIRAELWSVVDSGANAGQPNAKIADLDVPSSISAGAVSFEAPAGTVLAASTSYFFMLYTTGNFDLRIDHVTTTGEDSGGDTEWGIADNRYYKENQQPSGSNAWTSATNPLRITVKGSKVAVPSVPRGVTAMPGDAKLTIGWEAPRYWGTLPAARYCIGFRLTGDTTWSIVPQGGGADSDGCVPSTTTSFVFTGDQLHGASPHTVANGTSYEMRISALSQVPGTDGSDGDAHFRTSSFVTLTDLVPVVLSSLTGASSTDGTTFDPMTGADAIVPARATTATGYRATVGNDTTHVKLTPTVADATSTVKVGPSGGTLSPVTSGSASAAIALDVGDNAITVEVTAADSSTKTFTVTVRRVPAGTVWHATLVPAAIEGPQPQHGDYSGVGCHSPTAGGEPCISQLTDDTFEYGSLEYQVVIVADFDDPSDFFQVQLESVLDDSPTGLSFCVGDDARAIPEGTNGIVASTGTDIGWTEGVPVSLSIGTACDATTLPTITLSSSASSVAEGGTVTITAELSEAAPTGGLTVALARQSASTAGGNDFSVSAITVSAGATSGTAMLTATDDRVDEEDETLVLRGTATGHTAGSLSLTIADNDTAGATVSATSRSVAVSGTAAYTVRLNSQPTANVVITATSSDTTKATVSPATLTFTDSNWATAQEVTITGVAAGTGLTVTHAVTTANTAGKYLTTLAIDSVAVTVTATALPTITLSSSASGDTAAEGGSAVTVTATLSEAAPSGNVTVTLEKSGTATETDDYTLAGSITVLAGATSGTATLTVVDDRVDEEDETLVLRGTATGHTAGSLSLTIADNDTAGATVSATSRSVAVSGTAAYTVRLNSQPTANVVITATSSDTTKATVSPATLTFTDSNWATAQEVTITGVAAGTGLTVTHAVTTANTAGKYLTTLAIDSVAVTVTAQPPPPPGVPTVSLSASPNPVRPGNAGQAWHQRRATVIVTATLSRPLDRLVVIPVTTTRTTSEQGDHGLIDQIVIGAGQLEGSRQIGIFGDRDSQDDTFTVALDTARLPRPITAGATPSVVITIDDADSAAAPSAAVTGLTATPKVRYLVLTWNKPSERATHYEIQYKTAAAPDQDATGIDPTTGWVWRLNRRYGTEDTTTRHITRLTAGTTYDVRVRAVNDTAPGPWATTQATPCERLTRGQCP